MAVAAVLVKAPCKMPMEPVNLLEVPIRNTSSITSFRMQCQNSRKSVPGSICSPLSPSSLPSSSRESRNSGRVVIVMGVSGAGKSTIGELVSKRLGCAFLDADDFHPVENREKMRNGIALTESDRVPWLEKLRDVLADHMSKGESVVLACSALRQNYRDILRSAGPRAEKIVGTQTLQMHSSHGDTRKKVTFVHLTGTEELFASRLAARHKEGKHFMPPSLLKSQMELLEHDEDSASVIAADASVSPIAIVEHIMKQLPRSVQ